MSYKDKYKVRDKMYGVNVRDIRVHSSNLNLSSIFKDSPVYYQVADIISNEKYDLQITDNSNATDTKKFITPFSSLIELGITIDWKNDKWIVIHFDENSEIYKSGILRKCLSTIKWQESNGEVNETFFTYTTTALGNFGVDNGKIVTLDNERRQLTIQNNENTYEFKKGKRFIFDDRAWRISSIDKLDDNLIYLVLDADNIDPSKDNVELRIADYVKPNYVINLNQTSISLKPDDSFQLSVSVTNNNKLMSSPLLSFTSSDFNICTIDDYGLISAISEGNATINVSYKDISTTLDVVVVPLQTHNYSVVINGDVSITKSKTKAYSCEFYDNELAVQMDGVFSLTDVNNKPTSLATITTQSNNSCIIRGDSIGYILLHVSNADGSVTMTKQIQIKSAI
ncbi:hypothetical protein GRF59_15200 [Paenibacillus sp. HJL G12]|uniref:BIG2 domain-containing protein n=1 Tax=Paenibacillus dendrobii TaxID=2691084 RepID=A0A7X3IK32_9BACL|nr:Ig-like domain-containing protein [Paenibacillus dendrobii]MWV44968.1 hypothetical protein [Paenibacillus dendrobii]